MNSSNVALIPGDQQPIALSNFNDPDNKEYYKVATGNDNPFGYNAQELFNEIESLSVVLTASVTVNPNTNNHIKFAVADSGDTSVDSFVFIQGGSLSVAPGGAGAITPTFLTLDVASDSGVTGDLVTSMPFPIITGSAIAGGTVAILVDGLPAGNVVAADDGTWSFQVPTALMDGPHSFTATLQIGEDSPSAPSSPLTMIVDTMGPAAPTTLILAPASDSGVPGDLITRVTQPTISGTAEPGSTVQLYEGETLLGTGAVGLDGSWRIPVSADLMPGPHVLTTTSTDAAGNVSMATGEIAVVVDTAPPSVPLALALELGSDSGVGADLITNVIQPTITGIAEAGSTVQLYEGETLLGTGLADEAGAWSITVSTGLAAGPHGLAATTTDAAGNVSASSATLTITIDAAAPVLPTSLRLAPGSDSGVTGDLVTHVTQPTIAGTAEAGSTVQLYEGEILLGAGMADEGGAWSIALATALADGPHPLTITTTDAAGNTSELSDPVTLTIDTAAPAVQLAPMLDPSSDSGVGADLTTNVAQPTIAGTAEAGSTVQLYEGAILIGTGTVDEDGTWNIATAAPLIDGSHLLTTTTTDVAGNVSATSDPLAVTIDTMAPAAPTTLTLDPGSDSGVAGDRITNVTQPTITGTAEAGSTVQLYEGETLLGTGLTNGAGIWSIALAIALADGPHTMAVATIDAASNTSELSAPITLTIDTAAPALQPAPVLDPNSDSGVPGDLITSATQPSITGTAEAGSTVQLYEGESLLGTDTAGEDGTWNIDPSAPLADGPHRFTVLVTDAAGNTSQLPDPFTLTIDTGSNPPSSPPVLDPDSDSGGVADFITNVSRPTISGNAAVGSTVAVTVDGEIIGNVPTDEDGTWRFTLTEPLADGAHDFVTTTTDEAGNVSTSSERLSVTIDTVSPALPPPLDLAPGSDSGVTGDLVTHVTQPTIAGTAEAGSTVQLYEGEILLGAGMADEGGAWSIALATALADGPHPLTITTTDAAGNTSELSDPVTLTIDTAAPAVQLAPMLDPSSDSGVGADLTTNVAQPTITGTAEAGSTVQLYEAETLLGTGIADEDGNWRIAVASVLGEGPHLLTTTTTDVAGNVSATSDPLAVTIDTTVPAAPMTLTLDPGSDSGVAADRITSIISPIITGTAEANAAIVLYDTDGTSVLGSTEAADNGNWSITSAALSIGTHTLTAVASDPAGNASGISSPLVITTAESDLPAIYVNAGGVSAQVVAKSYEGPISYLLYEFLGSQSGEAVISTGANDFVNLLGGDDAADGGEGDDVLDGGTGSNFLTGGAGRDVFFVDGSNGETTWSTITDWAMGEQLAVWGWRLGVSQATWVDDAGAEGYRGVTMHADLNGDSIIDTSVTWTGLARADLPAPAEQDGLLWFV